MGFNKQRMESERRSAAEKEAEARRALGPQMLADSEKLIATWNSRQEARMPMLFANDRGGAPHQALVPLGLLPGLSNHGLRRSSPAGSASADDFDGADPGAVMSIVPAECSVCGDPMRF
jgi:hypothetical protein